MPPETARVRLIFWGATALIAAIPLTLCDAGTFARTLPSVLDRLLDGAAFSILMASLAWRAAVVTSGGALAGGVVGLLVYAAFGWSGWLLLGAGLATTAAATRLGHARKYAAGLAEGRGGRRASGNIVANTGVAGAAAIVALGSDLDVYAAIAAAAAIVTAVSDTVSTETGQVWGKRPRLVTSLRQVPPGTSGAVSVQGLAAGASSALLLSVFAASSGLVVGAAATLIVATAAIAASLIEGVVAIVVERRGWLDNDGVNLLNAAIGAGLATSGCAWWQLAQ